MKHSKNEFGENIAMFHGLDELMVGENAALEFYLEMRFSKPHAGEAQLRAMTNTRK